MCGYCPSTQRSRSWYIAHFVSVMLGCARSSAWPLLSLALRAGRQTLLDPRDTCLAPRLPRKSLKMLIAVPSPRLRTAPTIAHREYDCSRDLRPAKRGSGGSVCTAAILSRSCPLLGHSRPSGSGRCRSSHVRYAPKATFGHQNASGRDGPKADKVQCSKKIAIRSPHRQARAIGVER
jgi:hypothetical protein